MVVTLLNVSWSPNKSRRSITIDGVDESKELIKRGKEISNEKKCKWKAAATTAITDQSVLFMAVISVDRQFANKCTHTE